MISSATVSRLAQTILLAACCQAAVGQSVPPPTASDLTEWIALCPAARHDLWAAVDEIHEELVQAVRALPTNDNWFTRQSELENKFIDDLSTVVQLSPDCVEALKEIRQEARHRIQLAQSGIHARIPSIDAVVSDAALRLMPPVIEARRSAIRALISVAKDLAAKQSEMVQFDFPTGHTLRPDELSSLRSAAKALESIAPTVGPVKLTRMRERLALAAAGATEDAVMDRVSIILSHLRDPDPANRACIDGWTAAQRKQRGSAREQLLTALVKGSVTDDVYRSLQRQAIEDVDRIDELRKCLLQEHSGTIVTLITHWDDLENPLQTAQSVVDDRGVLLLTARTPTLVQPLPEVAKPILVRSIATEEICAQWKALVEEAPTVAQVQYFEEAVRAWNTSELPALEKRQSAIASMNENQNDSRDVRRLNSHVQSCVLERSLASALLAAELRLRLTPPYADSVAQDLQALARLWHLDRVHTALSNVPLRSWATVGAFMPRPTFPFQVMLAMNATPSSRAKIVEACASQSAALWERFADLTLACLDADTHHAALDLAACSAPNEEKYANISASLIPQWHGGSLPQQPTPFEETLEAWDRWLAACDAARAAIRATLPTDAADSLMARWMLACYPQICGLTECSLIEDAPTEHPKRLLHQRLLKMLRELEDLAFKPRTPRSSSALPPPQVRIQELLEFFRVDTENAKERMRRKVALNEGVTQDKN